MPHIVVLYTNNLEAEGEIAGLCRSLADTLLEQRDESDKPVFPRGGTRVFAYPSAHHAVSDGGVAGRSIGESGDYGFVYLNLRMGVGRSELVKKRVGDALLEIVKRHFDALLASRRIGLTLQIDESPGQVYDGKLGNLHDLFK
jgi:5-carboxymethyl-2-hydroxymuconate isomerase